MTSSAPRNGSGPRMVPPPPNRAPYVPAPPPADRRRARSEREPRERNSKVNIEKVNLVPDLGGWLPNLSLSVNKTTVVNGGGQAAADRGIPGSDFLSNEDIRTFCEWSRKDARNRSTRVAMDVDMLEARLKSIPDVGGSMSGARARAKRVVRWGRRIAQAEKLIAKWYASLYGAFEREYETELVKIGRGRMQEPKRVSQPFRWS